MYVWLAETYTTASTYIIEIARYYDNNSGSKKKDYRFPVGDWRDLWHEL